MLTLVVVIAMTCNVTAQEPGDSKVKSPVSPPPRNAKPLTPAELQAARKRAAGRKRRIVFHSDGMAMDPEKRYLESSPCVFPYIPGSQTDACTYSLIHQFAVARHYRSKVAQEWPPGIMEKLYGDGPDGLDSYIDFCRKNGYEAFWAMRMNDTHDASDTEHGRRRWNSNKWKQEHPEYLMGTRDTPTPYGKWSAVDYAHPEVRELMFRILEEVCQNYDIDGLLLDFFRHLPTFKTTVMGGEATPDELEMMNDLFRRIRRMIDEMGAKRGRPILLAVRTPDSAGYARELGLDVEQWMKQRLIDIWVAGGYFRLQEWAETVAMGHKHDVQVWASMDESRVRDRDNRNSLEAYRARIMNAWSAGVEAVWLFNFFYLPDDPQFKLLSEAGDPEALAFTDKMYVADARGRGNAQRDLKGGERFFTRPMTFSPENPITLEPGESATVDLLVGDDVTGAKDKGYTATVTLRIQASPGTDKDDLIVRLNDRVPSDGTRSGNWVEYELSPTIIMKGTNRIDISRGPGAELDPVLRDLQLWIRYEAHQSTQKDRPQWNS